MIVDASAALAVLLDEPDAPAFAEALAAAEAPRMSVVNHLEAAIRVDRLGRAAAVQALEALLASAGVEIVPATVAHGRLARLAFATYGKGRHPAALNFGDCFAYALAKETGRPLLFKGEDFAQTDLVAALP